MAQSVRAGPAKLRAGVGVNVIRLRIASKWFTHLRLQFLPYHRAGDSLVLPCLFWYFFWLRKKVRE